MIKLKPLLNEMTSMEILAEMSVIGHKDSNLSVKLWIGYHNGSKHFVPYVKVMKFGDNRAMASISIGDPTIIIAGDLKELSSKEIKKIQEFILLNKDTLLYYYYHAGEENYDATVDLYQRLQKV